VPKWYLKTRRDTMREIMEKCIKFTDEIESMHKIQKKKLVDLTHQEEKIVKKEHLLHTKDAEIITRERNLIPSEQMIEREKACSKKEREVADAMKVIQARAKNSNDAVEEARRQIMETATQLKKREQDIIDREKIFNDEKANWKSKLIEQIQSGQ
jgi:hypothetical protein